MLYTANARTVLAVIALAGGLTAQIERPIPYPLPQSRDWKKAIQAGTRSPDGAPGPNYWTNYADYRIKAELDPKTARLTGHIEMTYHNRSPKPVRRLLVHLRQNLHKQGGMRNRPVEITGGVEVDKLTVDGKAIGERRVGTSGTVMTVRLPERVPPGKSVELAMDWSYTVPKRGAPRNGHENFHVYYLGYWYPQFAVLDDVSGWVADQYMSRGEFYMDYADYDVQFTAPRGFLVRATGTLENPRDVLPKRVRERLKKARKTRDIVHVVTAEDLKAGRVTRTNHKKLTWHFKASSVRDFAVSVSDRYVWDATHAVIKDRDGPGKDGIAMIHAVYETNASAFAKAAEFGRYTIEHMSKLVYPYPWPHMTACEGLIGGGMEYPMMTLCGSSRRGSVQGVITHELIHMWFPMLVGSNEKAHAWQDEGVTSFFTQLTTDAYRNRKRPVPTGGYFRMVARGEAAPMMRHADRYPPGFSYTSESYTKMSAVMAQLQALLGDEVFFAAMRTYANEWAFKHPDPLDFFHTFDRVSGKNLDWYFRTWFYETWTLDQAIESVTPTEGGTEIVIADLGNAPHPTKLEVTYAGGQKQDFEIGVAYWLSGKRKKKLTVGANVEQVVIDPDRSTLDISRSNNIWPPHDR